MSQRARVIIDTSTLIGAMLRPASVPRQAFMLAVGTQELCVSVATLEELREVVHRPKFDRYTSLQKRVEFLNLVSQQSRLWPVDVSSDAVANNACRDTKDAKFLALALSCEAATLISSDADLLDLHPWHSIPILTPAAFLQTHAP